MIYDYIVIGGGIGGLYANYKLLKNDYNGLLLEKNDVFGGLQLVAKKLIFLYKN